MTLGFWEVETASLRKFPQEFRMFDIIRNNDNTISILAINVDPAVRRGALAAKSRSYVVADKQILKLDGAEPYNAEFFKQLTPEMQKKNTKFRQTDAEISQRRFGSVVESLVLQGVQHRSWFLV